MMAKKCKSCDCVPTQLGFYWATHRKWGWRKIVEVGMDGRKVVRVFVPRFSASVGIEEFTDYSGPIKERKK